MKRMLVIRVLTSLAVLSSTAPSLGEGVYIEAESVAPVHPWVLSTEKAGYLGSGYFEWTAGFTSTPQGILEYTFTTQTEGHFIVTLRGRRDNEGICEGLADDMCNDVFTKLDDRDWKKTMIKGAWNRWIWDAELDMHTPGDDNLMGVPRYYLEPGTHTFLVAGRSRGIKFDAFTVHLEGTVRPDGPVDSNAVMTAITAPAEGATLVEGQVYTLTAEGEEVRWSYDADSDRLGEIAIGAGNSVELTVPTGVVGARTITIMAKGANGFDQRTYSIGTAETAVLSPVPGRNAPVGGKRICYSISGRAVVDAVGQGLTGVFVTPVESEANAVRLLVRGVR